METSQDALAGQLLFKRYDMVEGVPVSMLFSMAAGSAVCGIYILEFADGARYVGQTTNILRRFREHQHHHGDVTAFSFAPCGAAQLDDYERAVIKVQQQGHDLRNKMLTDLPGGTGTLEIEISDVATVRLPWDRASRSTMLQEPASSKDKRFWKLLRRPDGGTELEWVLNAWPEGLADKWEALTGAWLEKAHYLPNDHYSTAGPVISITCVDMETFAHAVDLDFVLDAAYRLNVSMMRRSKSVFAKFHNTALAADIFREISVSTYSGSDTFTQLTHKGRRTWRKHFSRWLFGTR